MLLSSLFTFRVGPVLHVDLPSHFLTFVWGKNIGTEIYGPAKSSFERSDPAIMANNDPETVAQLYGVFLYKKKDIIAIQKKLGISGNANQLVVPPVSELMKKTLADSYELLLELVGDLIPIQEKLNIDGNPILEEAL
ncbi:hypothetical protein RhiirA1_485420 [Rhizophagus irregularis]|uniref:Uncharacterized protein n=1 Tax=Rhizophagus irregularis TaxID=588596 RepID=A0A2N0QI86_9GLOM|nr:hypothetical protein RhiirA1_485420 [Rhizophagus irregularis]